MTMQRGISLPLPCVGICPVAIYRSNREEWIMLHDAFHFPRWCGTGP